MKFDLVVFFLPQEITVNGGVISIFSLCKETRILLGKQTKTVLCLLPGGESFHKNDLFDNDEYILDIQELATATKSHKRALFHVPEFKAAQFHHLMKPHIDDFKHLDISINILNQNIEYMPTVGELSNLFLLSSSITQTTAHIKYCSQDTSNRYGLPVHLFSVHIDPSNYRFVPYKKKENLILYSLDKNPLKKKIITELKNNLENYRLQEIKGLRFEDYKDLISRSKFVITFGEGFDGYLIEPTFAGGISFAVYNDKFFPDASYKSLPNIFSSYEDMRTGIVEIIRKIDSEKQFTETNKKLFDKLAKIYSKAAYQKNIAEFYTGKLDFIPSRESVMRLIKTIVEHKQNVIDSESRQVDHLNNVISDYISEREKLLSEITLLGKDLAVANAFIERVHSIPGWAALKKLDSVRKKLIRKHKP